MKKLLLIIAAVFLISAVKAEEPLLTKGRLLTGVSSTIGVGGYYGSELMSLGFIKTKYPDSESSYTTTGFNFLPRGGYFVMDNFAAGLDFLLGFSSEKSSGDYKSTESGFGIGPFGRYYYPLEKCWPFAEASIMVGSETSKYSYGGTSDYETKWGFVMFALGVGASKSICDCATIDLMAGYSHAIWNNKDADGEGGGKEICSGIIIKAGITILFVL